MPDPEIEISSDNSDLYAAATSADFVGRQQEMSRLVAALDNACSGHGKIIMLSGDPGIGKTWIAQETDAIADARNAEVLWGHCYEGEGAPPYWPWLQVIRSHIDKSDAEHLEEAMGSGAEVIGEIVPELRSKLPGLGTPPMFDPSSARFRLFDSITAYLKNASATRPLALILEDLHWADASSLALLEHFASDMRPSSLLIVGTYRDIETPDDHPLTRTIGGLVRQEGFQILQLGGLSQDDVSEMVATSVGGDAPSSVVEKVHLRTEGNALFVVELLKLLEASGLDETDEWQFAIPEGIRGVISRRFEVLSVQCNETLTIASVIGREFEFDLLSQITGSSDDDLLDVVDEAVEAHVIEDMRGSIERYRFTHALIEQTLYERLTSSRRARLHSQIGETLEDVYAENVGPHASELVRHFSRSPRRQDSEKVLRYGKLAANHATSVYAYGEAAKYLDQCLDAQKSLDPNDDETRLDLLNALGEGLIIAGDPQRAYEYVAPEAFALAEARDDSSRAFHSSLIASQGITAFGAYTATSTPEYGQWVERADRNAEPETADRIEADFALATMKYHSREFPETWDLLHRALGLAHQLDDPEYLVRCSQTFLAWQWPAEYQKDLYEIASEGAESPVLDVSPRIRGGLLSSSFKYLLMGGDGDRAWPMYDKFLAFVEQTKIPYLRALALALDIRFKTFRGELEGAVKAIDDLIAGSKELGSAALGLQLASQYGVKPLLYLGQAEDALALIPQARESVGLEPGLASTESLPDNFAEIVLSLAHAGHLTEAQ
ncbi:MAG: AAA family ATPase [SAR202 cluster bacterium]|nr:AAA family ATPase [SAR202 cluster bacterium]